MSFRIGEIAEKCQVYWEFRIPEIIGIDEDIMTKLEENLIAAVDPKCNERQCIQGKGYRITVLTSELFRIEVSTENSFLDKATQVVWFRNFDNPEYTTKEIKNNLQIITDKVTLFFDTKSLKAKYIKFNDSNRKEKCNNKYNLKGTIRTLDVQYLKKRLENGIMSLNGVSVYDDSKSLILDDDGMIKPRETKSSDIYIFAYGNNFRECLKDFFRLTGKTPLIPRYALSNWWSRYKAYSQEEYIDLMKRFIKEDIPITVAVIDMDWHWVNVNKKFGTNYRRGHFMGLRILPEGWTGYSWNTDLFPDYKAFLEWLQKHNFKVTLNLHPADGVRPYEDMYKEMALEVGIDPDSKEYIKFDITDPKFVNAYFKILHHPYEAKGVDFWWIDWQQGRKSKTKGLDPLWALNHYHFLDNRRKDKRPLVLSRYAGVGSHRYPLGFSGDTVVSWSTLKFQIYFTATATNIGYTWWSHDIGGHCFGTKDDELYLRWVQYGVFSPILRLHSTSHDLQGKEPWNYSKDVEIFTKEQLRLRHRLLPYIYSMNYRTYDDGIALVEPMYYAHPEDKRAYSATNQYYFGSELIVCPITKKINKRLKAAYSDVWLPEGRWTDFFTGQIYKGNKWVRMFRGLNTIPVLAKEGAIIPTSDNTGNDCSNPEKMTLHIYRGNSSFMLYEDNGHDNKYTDGEYATTTFSVEENNNITFNISKVQGVKEVIPKNRQYKLLFKDIVSAEKVEVRINDKIEEINFNTNSCLSVELKNIEPDENVRVIMSGYKIKGNISYNEAIIEILTKYQTSNILKMLQYKILRYTKSKDIATRDRYIEKIKRLCVLPKVIRGAIEEYLDNRT